MIVWTWVLPSVSHVLALITLYSGVHKWLSSHCMLWRCSVHFKMPQGQSEAWSVFCASCALLKASVKMQVLATEYAVPAAWHWTWCFEFIKVSLFWPCRKSQHCVHSIVEGGHEVLNASLVQFRLHSHRPLSYSKENLKNVTYWSTNNICSNCRCVQ